MKIGTLNQVVEDMENGVFNFCKDGKCIGCGNCCSDFLPLSQSEIKDIKRYIEKKHIEATKRNLVLTKTLDMVCPFLDDTEDCDKCKIYPVRPQICRVFKCDTPPSKVKANKELFWRDRKPCSMRQTFFEKDSL